MRPWLRLSHSPLSMRDGFDLDFPLLISCLILLGLGLVMVTSASLDVAAVKNADPYYYTIRHLVFLATGIGCGLLALMVPLSIWQRQSTRLLLLGIALLVLVLIPGIGREVNGSQRWISLGAVNLQVSELAKLFTVLYMADYLVRRETNVKGTWLGLALPIGVLGVQAGLLLLEPDFGALVVLVGTGILMLFLGGVSLWRFSLISAGVAVCGAVVMLAADYRRKRLTNFTDPWADPYGDGYQLTQALIAFGRGDWFGQGLGGSVQKQFFLPEAHTDFVFSILAEELGLFGSLATVLLFVYVGLRCWRIAMRAELRHQHFSASMAYGLGTLWIGQFLINIGVNIGLLPTKGLTLPFLSYGGSSLVVCCISLALLLRIDWETRNTPVISPDIFTAADFAEEERRHGR